MTPPPSSVSGRPCSLSPLPDLNEAEAAEWQSLSGESNPVLLDEAKLRFGRQLEQKGRLQASAAIFAGLAGNAADTTIRNQAQGELEALQGGGSFGARFQLQSGQMLRELLKPEPILLMAAGSMALRLGKLATLGKLASLPEAGWLSRGFGLRTAANTAGWLAETSTFALGSMALESVAGHSVSLGDLGKNFASTALLLGSLRLTGHAAGLLSSPATRGLAQQAGVYGGIMLADRIETKLGLKIESVGASPWLNAFLTWAQFNAGGALAHGVLGEGFRAFESKLEFAISTLQLPPNLGGVLPGAKLAFAAGPQLEARQNFPTRLVDLLAASLTNGGSAGSYPREARFKLLDESPREATFEDLAFWARELNADPSNPLCTLDAMRILHRIEGTRTKNPEHIEKGAEIVQREAAKLSIEQIEGINKLLEKEYSDGKPIVHGLRFLEETAMFNPDPKVQSKAMALRKRFDLRFKRYANGKKHWGKMPLSQQLENLNSAARLGDEALVSQWVAHLVHFGEVIYSHLLPHPHAVARQFMLSILDNHIAETLVPNEFFHKLWSNGERQRIVSDIQSGELLRSSKALDILQLFLSRGIVEAFPLYQKFLDHLSGVGPLSPEAIDAEARPETSAPTPIQDRETRLKLLLTSPDQATPIDVIEWSMVLNQKASPQELLNALKVLSRIQKSSEGDSPRARRMRVRLQDAFQGLSETQLAKLASFREFEFQKMGMLTMWVGPDETPSPSIDLIYWCDALNEKLGPGELAETLRVLFLMREYFEGDSTQAELARDSLKEAMQRIRKSQLFQLNSFLENQYRTGSSAIHGLWFLDEISQRDYDREMRAYARKLASSLSELYVKNSVGRLDEKAPLNLTSQDLMSAWEHLEEAAKIEDELRARDWIAAILQHPIMEPKGRDLTLKILLQHSNAFIRKPLLEDIEAGHLSKVDFPQLWADGEKTRLLQDLLASRDRAILGGNILAIFARNGVAEAASLLEQYGDILASGRKLKPEDLN